MSFVAELRRRNVIRMAGLYLVGAWLIVQVAQAVLPAFDVPTWVLRAIIIVLALGFVPALVFAWVFELTPEGLKRDAEVPPERSIAAQTGRRMDRTIIAVLALALGWFALDKYVLAPGRDDVPRASAATGTASKPASPDATPATPAPTTLAEQATAPPKSIAVLAFADMSPAKDSEYLSDGIAEEILNALSHVGDLKVAGRTSSFYFKGRNEDLKAIGATLGVANVLEGSVRRQGDKVRITAQLIRVDDGFHRWSETYDGDLADVFALQERIARAITGELKVVLSDQQQQRLVDAGTQDLDAYSRYLRGRHYWSLRTAASLQQAIEQFRAAAEADPQFALAFSGLADCYSILAYNASMRSDRSMAQARLFATRALAIDDRLAEAHTSMAYTLQGTWDWAAAEKAFLRAIELNPRYATAQFWYARLLVRTGRSDEGLQRLRQALEIEPLSRVMRDNMVQILLSRGDAAAALAEARHLVELAPEFPTGRMMLAHALLGVGQPAQALEAAEQGLALEDQGRIRWSKMRALAALGRKDEAAAMARELESRYDAGETDAFEVAAGHASAGDADAAFRWLDRARADRSALLGDLRVESTFLDLHADPRFRATIAAIGMPE